MPTEPPICTCPYFNTLTGVHSLGCPRNQPVNFFQESPAHAVRALLDFLQSTWSEIRPALAPAVEAEKHAAAYDKVLAERNAALDELEATRASLAAVQTELQDERAARRAMRYAIVQLLGE